MNSSQPNSKTASLLSSQSLSISDRLVEAWYQRRWWLWLLTPLSLLFYALSSIRRFYLKSRLVKKHHLSVPVIVVGNISVGGTGKTPLIVALCKHLKKQGYRPGVISRGYGSSAPYYPFVVNEKSSAEESGDEPLMIAVATRCPVVIDRDRCSAAKKIIEDCHVNVILSDDGLQHYRLQRDIEIIVVDQTRGFGNGFLLPAGPLRESISRLNTADFVIENNNSESNGGDLNNSVTPQHYSSMEIRPKRWVNLDSSAREIPIDSDLFSGKKVHAIAGIGNPQRFYSTLDMLKIDYMPHSFQDHHQYITEDISFDDANKTVVMTEKDAVKIKNILPENHNYWYLSVESILDPDFLNRLFDKLSWVRQQK